MASQPSPAESLKDAICRNDAAAVAAVLERHPELKSELDRPVPDLGFGATALLGAVYRGNREMIDILLRAGADINARSHWWAGGFGVLDHDGDLADFLIERGAFVDVHAAARLGKLDRLHELISANPDLVHARGGDGQTPLHVARDVGIAQVLLERGADIDARDVDHESTPAQYMIRDRQDVAWYLVDRGCRTDILMAAALGDVARVERHLEVRPDSIRTRVSDEHFARENPRSGGTIYNWTLGAGKSAHAVARDFERDGVFRLLWDRSPDDLKLTVACELGDEAPVHALLADQPSLVETLAPDDHRRLPDAARDGNHVGVRLMLAAGWPIDARGQHGATALHWAAWRGDLEMVRELVRRGASIELTDRDHGGTPLSWAVYASVHGWHPDRGDYGGSVAALLSEGARPPGLTTDLDASPAVRDVLMRAGSGRPSQND